MSAPQHTIERHPTSVGYLLIIVFLIWCSGCRLGSSVDDQGSPVQIFDLCIGVTPPESMYLPLPEPPTDTSALDAIVADVHDTTLGAPSDVLADVDNQSTDTVDADGADGGDVGGEDALAQTDQGVISQDAQSLASDADASSFAAEVTELADSVVSGEPDATPNISDIEQIAAAGADVTDDAIDGQTSQTADGGEIGGLLPPINTCAISPGTCVGEAAPEWALFDFQPQSCGYQATYGLKQFASHVTVVVLLAAW